jgi:hypothetical protein
LDLEKQKLDLEKEKIDLEKRKILQNDDNKNIIIDNNINAQTLEDIIKKIFQENFTGINTANQQIKTKDHKAESESGSKTKINETQNSIDNAPFNIKLSSKTKTGQKIRKIDPDNLKHIIKVYDSMAYVMRDLENKGFTKTGIQDAIKSNKLYKDFRWNYVKSGEDPNICDIPQTQKCRKLNVETIIQLNSTKTEILDSFCTLGTLSEKLGIGSVRLNNIIANNKKYNEHYYIRLSNCPQDLLDKYKKPINKFIYKNSKRIKQINPITKEIVIFDSLFDIYRKYGIPNITIIKAINDKVVCNGFLWEYYNI